MEEKEGIGHGAEGNSHYLYLIVPCILVTHSTIDGVVASFFLHVLLA